MLGKTISRFRILEKIGAGGMGEVYLAEDDRLGRKLALKILPEQFTVDQERVRRFEQEARAASALNHPNIITIYEIGQQDGLHFIATEFIAGETLRERLNAGGLSLADALDIASQTASALQAAHAAGIAHRDIKPENIMVRPDGYVKVLDFGLAKLTEQTTSGDLEAPTRSLLETTPGIVMGTVAYMSPEQARGQRVDGRTDIFSLGVVLYEMICGTRPFTGETTSDIIVALLASEPIRPSQQLPGIPAELEQIVALMLAKDRDNRYQTAQEIITDLKRVKARVDLADDAQSTMQLEPPTARFAALSENPRAASASAANVPSQPGASAKNDATVSYETNVITAAQTPVATAMHSVAVVGAQRRHWLLPALLGLALLLAGGLMALRYVRNNATIDSIAVLPFLTDASDQDAEYLSEGIAEGIINSLSQVPELGVSSRNAVIRYKGKEADARQVGQDLEVKAVLLGRIKRRGDSLTINAELVNAANGRQIWGEQFNRKLSDVMAVQTDIARNITEKLRFRLTDAQRDAMAERGTQNAEAYDLYLKGRYYWNLGTPEALKKADEYFEAAAGKDGTYADAFAGCAACHAAGSDQETPVNSMPKAKKVALAALKVDDGSADAHLTLAQVNLRYDWDYETAEREFKRALALNPKSAVAHQRYAEFLALMGRHKEAATEIWQARALDPRSVPVNSDIGRLSYYAKDYPHALDHLRKAITLDDNFASAHNSLGLVYEQQRQTQDAILEFMRAQRLLQLEPEKLTALKAAFANGGREAFWKESLTQLQAEAGHRYIPQSWIAMLHVRLGENDKAFAALEKAVQEKDGGVVELKVEPIYEPLRQNSKFNELLRLVGLSR